MKKYLTIVNDDLTETRVEEPQSEFGFTYADYLKWDFRERIELIHGKLLPMSAPTLNHQKILLNLIRSLDNFFLKHQCELYSAPVDVRLKGKKNKLRKLPDEEIKTVVQPDIIVVCDKEKLKDIRSVDGAPDLIIEILSPGNSKKGMQLKYDLYEENEVKEYWIVYPEQKQVTIFTLTDRLIYDKTVFYAGNSVHSRLFPGLKMPAEEIFNL